VTERALLSQEEQQGNFDMVLDTSGQILPDISAGAMYWKTSGSRNWGGYSNPKFDETLKQHDVEVDDAKRKQFGQQLQAILDEDPPWYLIGFTFHLPMWRNEVKGMALDKRAFVQWGRMETAWIDK
jgi:ABC-type transport system substrate-binding protein